MILHMHAQFSICFFDRYGAGVRDDISNNVQIRSAQDVLKTSTSIIPNQVHGVQGIAVTQNTMPEQLQDADYLISNVPGIALIIYTADCLPIIVYDTKKHAIGLVHAGWPGSLQNIVIHCIQDMQKKFHSNVLDIEVYFGPSCKPCCYEVSSEFFDKLRVAGYDAKSIAKVLYRYKEKLIFDLPALNCLQLERAGIPLKSIHLQYNICTICSINYCSYRRDKNMKRQITAVALK